METVEKVLLSKAEVIRLGFAPSLSTLRRMVLAGDFPKPVRRSEGRVGYRRADLDAWLAAREPVA